MSSSLLTAINPDYFSKILQWKHIVHEPVGGLFKIDQFHNYNKLIDINSIFSSILILFIILYVKLFNPDEFI